MIRKTAEAAEFIGVPTYTLLNWIRYGVIPKPAKDSSGHYVWSDQELLHVLNTWEQRRQKPAKTSAKKSEEGG